MTVERRATYRLQVHQGFPLDAAAAVADYLADLGVSHLYTSPVLQAARGSTHGYDVVDPERVSEELGGRDALDRLHVRLAALGMGHLLDIVPNHMSTADRRNRWWWDVLRHGRGSAHCAFFDVDWSVPDPNLDGRVLVPSLDDHVGRVVAAGRLRLEVDGDGAVLRHHDAVYPLAPGTLEGPPEGSAAEPWLAARSDDVGFMDALLRAQNYRLAHWRLASEQDNSRRFFDITSLVALRMEREEVFAAVHGLVLDLCARGAVQGLRIDHVDGLRRPREYLERLRAAAGPGTWVVVEKILAGDEDLPCVWPVEGTTGYEFSAAVTGVLVDPRGEAPLTRLMSDLTGIDETFAETARAARLEVMATLLSADTARLTRLLARVCGARPEHRDYPLGDIRTAVTELMAALPVYRTYVVPGEQPSAQDESTLECAAASVRRRCPHLDPLLVDLLRDVLLGRVRCEAADELAARLPQTSGAVTAKAVEDTAFYRYPRLLALNEVGADPGRFGISLEQFHAANARRQERWPHTLLAVSTHDTKRGADVRARLAVLAERPAEWREAVTRWLRAADRHSTAGMPDAAMRYLFLQTLVGAHPLDEERAVAYMEKASREAKTHTSWTRPSPRYEAALAAFVRGVLGDAELMRDVAGFVARIAPAAWSNGLSMALLHLTAPGVPDIYQGSELWDLRLVDPDNRSPVDYAVRRDLLRRARTVAAHDAMAAAGTGLPKMLLVLRALALRRRRAADFGPAGAYRPLRARGEHADRVVAFSRGDPPGVVTVAPRFTAGLPGGWGDTVLALPPGGWEDVLTGARFDAAAPLAALCARFPVALLARP